MGRAIGSLVEATSLVITMAVGSASAQAGGASSIHIRTYDDVGLPPEQRARALRTAARVLARAGVEVSWVGCSGAAAADECLGVPGRQTLIVRIVHDVGPRTTLAAHAMGFAAVSDDGGTSAAILHDRVLVNAELGGVAADRVLGYALAHEIGHLLGLGHSRSGVMTARWDRQLLRRAALGQVRFTAAQSDRMRTNLNARGSALQLASADGSGR